MGIGFRKGNRQEPKKTAKALEGDINQLEARVRNAVMMLQMQLQQMNQRLVQAEQQAELIDFRSLSTLKLLVSKGAFTNEEHDAFAELLRIEAFEAQSARDNAERGLVVADPDTTLDTGVTYVARIDAFEPDVITTPGTEATMTEPATEAKMEPNPEAGKKIEQLSMLRMKVTFGSKEFPPEIEEQLKGGIAGSGRSFTIKCPNELGVYAGKTVTFAVTIIQLLKPAPKSVAVEPATVEAAPEAAVAPDDAPTLAVVEKPN